MHGGQRPLRLAPAAARGPVRSARAAGAARAARAARAAQPRRREGRVRPEHGAGALLRILDVQLAGHDAAAQDVRDERQLLLVVADLRVLHGAARPAQALDQIAGVRALGDDRQEGVEPGVQHVGEPLARGAPLPGRRRAHRVEHRAVAGARDLLDEDVLRGELEVNGADADAGLARHVGDRGLLRAVVPEQPVGHVEDEGASSLGVVHRGCSRRMNRFPLRSYQRARHLTATKHPPPLRRPPTLPRLLPRTLAPTSKGSVSMRSAVRLFSIAAIFVATCIGWVTLGGVMSTRSSAQSYELRNRVQGLWGTPQTQAGPALTFEWTPEKDVVRSETVKGVERKVHERVQLEPQKQEVSVASTRVDVDLHLDQRLKGLVWYALYDVSFRGAWRYHHARPEAGNLRVHFRFPDPQGVYDGFSFAVDGQPQDLRPKDGAIEALVPVSPGQQLDISIGYRSRGLDEWHYVPDPGVANLKDFRLAMTTDFTEIDFPALHALALVARALGRRLQAGLGLRAGGDGPRDRDGDAVAGAARPARGVALVLGADLAGVLLSAAPGARAAARARPAPDELPLPGRGLLLVPPALRLLGRSPPHRAGLRPLQRRQRAPRGQLPQARRLAALRLRRGRRRADRVPRRLLARALLGGVHRPRRDRPLGAHALPADAAHRPRPLEHPRPRSRARRAPERTPEPRTAT